MKLKLDENLGRRTAGIFVSAGHDVATATEQELTGVSDDGVFDVCLREQRVLVTLDLDFADPFRFDPASAAGIVVIRVPALPGRRDLDEAARTLIAAFETASVVGQLWVVRPGQVRQYEAGQG